MTPIRIHAALTSEAPKRFRIDAYSGGVLSLTGWQYPVVIDLAGLTAGRDGAPIVANLDHDPQKRVGQVDAVTNDGKALKLAGAVNAATAHADEFVRSAEQGFQWAASVEVQPERIEEVPRGKKATVNGREFVGPVSISRQSVLYGVAILSHGADSTARAFLAGSNMTTMKNTEFNTWLSQIHTGDPADMTPAQLAGYHANYHGRSAPIQADFQFAATAPVIHAAANLDPVAAEARRLRQIEAALSGDWEDHADRITELRAQAISGEIDIEELLKETRTIRGEIHRTGRHAIPMARTVSPPRRGGEGQAQVLTAAFCQALNLPNIEKHFDDRTLQAAHDQFRGGISLQQFILASAAATGYHVAVGERVSDGNLKRILAHVCPSQEEIRAGWSTISVTGILSNVANKQLLEGYMEEDATWMEIATIKSCKDFKEHTHYRLLDNSEYEEVGPAGEIKHGTLGEENYTTRVFTHAKMFSLTRHDIINDDLSAFDTLRVRLGRGSAQKLRKKFWTRFVNNSAFFTTGNGNYFEGGTSNLGTDFVGLQLGIDAFRNMRTPAADGSKKIGGQPVILLVPPELETTALRLYAPLAAAELSEINPYAGKYRPVVVDELSDSDYTGASTTAWYLFRDKRFGAPMAVSFLNGQQTPTVESAEADFNILGMSFRGYHDFGCDFAERLAGVKSKGTA